MLHRLLPLAAVPLVALFAITAACSGGGTDATTTASPGSSPRTASNTTASTTVAAAPSAVSSAKAPSPPDGNVISEIRNNQFEAVTQLRAGATVTWTNADAEPHTVVAADGLLYSGTLRLGDSFSQMFNVPGRYQYFCTLHSNMSGMIEVR